MKITNNGKIEEQTEYEKWQEYIAKAATNIYPQPPREPEPHSKKQTAIRFPWPQLAAIAFELYLLGNDHFPAAILFGLVTLLCIVNSKNR